MLLRHINPYGACDVPLLGRQGDPLLDEHGDPLPGTGYLAAGEEFECTEEHARILLEQHDNYAPADDAAATVRAEIDKARADLDGAAEPAKPKTRAPRKPKNDAEQSEG